MNNEIKEVLDLMQAIANSGYTADEVMRMIHKPPAPAAAPPLLKPLAANYPAGQVVHAIHFRASDGRGENYFAIAGRVGHDYCTALTPEEVGPGYVSRGQYEADVAKLVHVHGSTLQLCNDRRNRAADEAFRLRQALVKALKIVDVPVNPFDRGCDSFSAL